MSDSDSEEIDFLSGQDQQSSEEIRSPAFGRANPPEEPPQRQRVAPTGTQEEATQTAARQLFEEELQEQKQQEEEKEEVSQQQGTDSRSEQEETSEMSGQQQQANAVPVPTTLPTVHATAGDMFKTSAPTDVALMAGGTCENPRSERGADSKAINKTKDRATKGLELKFGLPYYYVSGKYGEDEDDGHTMATSTHDAIINVSYRCEEMKMIIKSFDLTNACLIPDCVNANGATPADRWGFSNRRHVLDHYGSITEADVKLWCEDCLCWPVSEYEKQDQNWLLTLARNSCTTELKVKIERRFSKLPGHMQGGVVYIWMMLDTIIHITDDVASALQQKIKEFAAKGLMSYKGENVESARVELVAICTRLEEKTLLPADSVNDIIKGLAKCSHPGFAKIFDDFGSARRNTLMGGVTLTGTTLEQIHTVLDAADEQYASFTLSNEWVSAGISANTFTIKCDNCGGNHISPKCTLPRDEGKIARNRAARGSRDGGGGRGFGGRGGGGRGGGRDGGRSSQGARRGFGGNKYGSGKYAPPKPNETIRKISGQVHCACKECGWNKGDNIHTTGGHYAAQEHDYFLPSALKAQIKKAQRGPAQARPKTSNDDGGDEKPAAKAGAFTFTVNEVEAYEKSAESNEASAWAGQFQAFLKTLPKE